MAVVAVVLGLDQGELGHSDKYRSPEIPWRSAGAGRRGQKSTKPRRRGKFSKDFKTPVANTNTVQN